MQKHKQSFFLPPTLLRENIRLPRTVSRDQLETLKAETPEKAEFAIKQYGKLLLEMDYMKLTFAPVKIEIQGKVYESPNSDFFRTFALFSSYFELDLRLLDNNEAIAKMYRERILKFGGGNAVEVFPFFKKESPIPTDFETHTYIRGPFDEFPLPEED